MRTSDDERRELREMIEETGVSISELAKRSGVHKSTIHRALNDEYEFVPSSRTIDKLTQALFDIAFEKGVNNRWQVSHIFDDNPDALPINLVLNAQFHSKVEVPTDLSPIRYSSRFNREVQFAARVGDESANRAAIPGDIVHILHHSVLRTLAPRPGDLLISLRENIDTDFSEVRLMEVVRVAGDLVHLRAPTTHPQFSWEGQFSLQKTLIHGLEQWSVIGVVIAIYRPTHFLAR